METTTSTMRRSAAHRTGRPRSFIAQAVENKPADQIGSQSGRRRLRKVTKVSRIKADCRKWQPHNIDRREQDSHGNDDRNQTTISPHIDIEPFFADTGNTWFNSSEAASLLSQIEINHEQV
ncbi:MULTISPECIES: hypothetical protein [unclassified Ensifer]|uniref:hypothetical protein n=1 Tax=unclassified Ensifer TaxID=2633371 RepID=UPI0030104AE3